MTQPDVSVRAVDQSGNVTNSQALKIPVLDDPDLRVERGERIGRNLGPGARNSSEQRGFPGIWVPDQPHLCDNAQFEQELAFVAGFAWLSKARRLARGRGKIAIAQAAPAP